MSTLFILDIADFRPLAVVGAQQPKVTLGRRGPYLTLSSDSPFEIDRAATECRNALWYSSVAAVRDGKVTRWDRHALRVEPISHEPDLG